MAIAPLELTQVQKYSKGMTMNIMILVFWLIIWLILTTKVCSDTCTPCCHIESISDVFELIFCISLCI